MGALAGVPFAPKDLFDTAGLRTTYGSGMFREHVPTRTASAVQRLVDAGAVIVGKANLHEFAWGVTSKNPFYGTVGNPRRPGHVAGGSSGGSAAALAAGLATLSIGTDTGGSIRIPSFACGTAGFKPSHGLVPIDGCFPLAPVFDHVGPMARTMEECALALEVLADLPRPEPRLAGLRVGVLAPIAELGPPRSLRCALRGGGAAALGARAPDLRRRVRLHPSRALRRAARRVLPRPAGQAGARLRVARRDLPRALGRGRRLAAALRGRVALRPAGRARRCRATCRSSRRRRRPSTARG